MNKQTITQIVFFLSFFLAYNISGQEVYNQKHQVTNQKNIDVQSSGLYVVSIEQNGQSHKLKLIVK